MFMSDGEFYPEKELSKNYRIPRRDAIAVPSTSQPPGIFVDPLSSTSFDNMIHSPYYPVMTGAYYNEPQFAIEPIVPTIPAPVEPVKEVPKSVRKNIFQETVPDIGDHSLPHELKLLFQPLYCKLCAAQLSSNTTARLHYKSKNHEKKVRKWLMEWSESTGTPLHPRAVAGNDKKGEEFQKNPAWFYCELCDLELTGQVHAESHYMGKNHQRAMMGRKTPAGQGFYDPTGKWVRVRNPKSKHSDGPDNFGIDFRQSLIDPTASIAGPSPAKKQKIQPTQFLCEICKISTTCQEQLDNHVRGQKHAKKLKQYGLGLSAEKKGNTEKVLIGPVLPEPPRPQITELNLTVYRTPSGDYYCPVCNSTNNSEPQFLIHLKGRGHAKKTAQPKS